jgi:hypothetical protein
MFSDNTFESSTSIIESELAVRCHSGHTYAERPISFIWQGVNHVVHRVVDAWVEPGRRHFVVSTENYQYVHLYYDEVQDHWSLLTEK